MKRPIWIVGSIIAIALMAFLVPVAQYAHWSGPYIVTVRINRTGDKAIAHVVADALQAEQYRYATDRLGSSPSSSPEYPSLLELNGLGREVILNEKLEFQIPVMRHGKDRRYPFPKRIHEVRDEKLAIRIDYVDGTMNCFIFEIPGPDQRPVIVANIP